MVDLHVHRDIASTILLVTYLIVTYNIIVTYLCSCATVIIMAMVTKNSSL